MKKRRLFAKIIYYIFTFAIGIVLAIVLPYSFADLSESGGYIADCLQEENFEYPLVMTTNAYNKTPVAQGDVLGGGKVVLFEALLYKQNTETDADGNITAYQNQLYRGLFGFMFGLSDDFASLSESENHLAIVACDENGTNHTIPLTDSDSDGDGTPDISTYLENYGFAMPDIHDSVIAGHTIKSLSITDANGNEVWSAELDYSFENSAFFANFDKIDEYNKNVVSWNEDSANRETYSNNMQKIVDGFVANIQNSNQLDGNNYHINKYSGEPLLEEIHSEIVHRGDMKALVIIIVYFVAVYVIGDFLLGNFYIVKFFNWFLFKVCRIPRRSKKSVGKKDVFGNDYYSMVTLSLDVSAVPQFHGSVEVRYTNSDSEAKWTLIAAENYTATSRIKAGTYVNPFIDIDRTYGAADMPENLVIEGYRVEKTIKIVPRTLPEQTSGKKHTDASAKVQGDNQNQPNQAEVPEAMPQSAQNAPTEQACEASAEADSDKK